MLLKKLNTITFGKNEFIFKIFYSTEKWDYRRKEEIEKEIKDSQCHPANDEDLEVFKKCGGENVQPNNLIALESEPSPFNTYNHSYLCLPGGPGIDKTIYSVTKKPGELWECWVYSFLGVVEQK